jgi:stage III sporulation protein AB
VWREELETCPLQLTAEDRQMLEQLGSVLGRYDGESQCRAIEEEVSRLGRQIVQAREDRRRLGRVYGVLGMTAGLFLAVLLI